jgi:hypothetical protein
VLFGLMGWALAMVFEEVPAAAEALDRMLHDADADVLSTSARGPGKIRGAGSLSCLLGALADPAPNVRLAVVRICWEVRAESLPVVIKALADPAVDLRMEPSIVLSLMDRRARPALLAFKRMLANEDAQARRVAAWAIREIER